MLATSYGLFRMLRRDLKPVSSNRLSFASAFLLQATSYWLQAKVNSRLKHFALQNVRPNICSANVLGLYRLMVRTKASQALNPGSIPGRVTKIMKRMFGMNLLMTIKDGDLGLDNPAPDVYLEREASRAIVFDNNKNIALLHATRNHYHKLPGGGLEEGEDVMDALRREILEEIGCRIKNIRELGIIEEYRNKFALHQTSYCFIADLDGPKGASDFTESEMADGFETVWLDFDDAIKRLKKEIGVEHYEGRFIHKRDLAFLEAARTHRANA